MSSSLLDQINRPRKQLALLLDPDTYSPDSLRSALKTATEAKVDYIFAGGSLLVKSQLPEHLKGIRELTDLPVVIFPGNSSQVDSNADGILLLSVISGRNAEMLIGQHVIAAPELKKSGLEILPTGYMLIDGGAPTAATYMSNTTPIPGDKPSIAMATAMAGEMLGLKLIYLDAGSGARHAVSPNMIKAVRRGVDIPVIVGGGLRDAEAVYNACSAGADMVVVGNAAEDDPSILAEMTAAVRAASESADLLRTSSGSRG